MAFTEITLVKQASDLVVDHYIGNFNNDKANITPAGVIPFGTVVFRKKGLAIEAPWAAVATDDDVAETNEYAVVYGDHYGFKYDFTPKAIKAKLFNAVVVKRGPVMLKEFYIKAVHGTALATKYGVLKQLLADQGVVVLDDVTNFKGTI